MSIQDYVRKHRVLRARMISADFPHIANETTTVKFMVEGLRPNPKFSDLIRIFKAFGCPGTITAFGHRLTDIEAENVKSAPTPKHRPQGAPVDQPHSGYRGRGRGYRGRSGCGRGRYGQHRNSIPNHIQQLGQLVAAMNSAQQRGVGTQGWGSGRSRPQENAAQSVTPEIDLSTLQALAAAATSTTPDPDEDSEQENNREYILDSGSQPSHVNHPLPHMKPLTKPVKTLTTTSISTDATHTGHLKVTTYRGFSLQIPAIVHPKINPNLLSVHDTAKQWCLVAFSSKRRS